MDSEFEECVCWGGEDSTLRNGKLRHKIYSQRPVGKKGAEFSIMTDYRK